jgi:alpha-amylase/alpha-mannosidase (GH57 family)
MNRDVIEPVADVMLMILEREFGITGNRDKMLCLEQFRDRLQRDFFTWIREGSINSVQQLLFSLINDAEPNKRSYVISGGVVFRHNPADDSLSFTSVVALYRFVGPSFESVLLKPKAPMWRATQGFF